MTSFEESDTTQANFRIGGVEKLILLMLSEIYQHLKIQGEVDPDFIKSAIFTGNYWGFAWKYPGIFRQDAPSPMPVQVVCDILDMWSFIESGYDRLSAEDKKFVEIEAKPYGVNPKFNGFDGNNEFEYLSIADFLIEQLDRFQEFQGRDLNSHHPSLEVYFRMLKKFELLRPTLADTRINASQLVELLREQIHPQYRTE